MNSVTGITLQVNVYFHVIMKKAFLNAVKSLNSKSQITVKYTYRKYSFQLTEGLKNKYFIRRRAMKE